MCFLGSRVKYGFTSIFSRGGRERHWHPILPSPKTFWPLNVTESLYASIFGDVFTIKRCLRDHYFTSKNISNKSKQLLCKRLKKVGKDLAVFSRIVYFWKEECAGGTRLMRKDSQTGKTIKDYQVFFKDYLLQGFGLDPGFLAYKKPVKKKTRSICSPP